MGLFDKLKNQATTAGTTVGQAFKSATGGKSVSVIFNSMPQTLAEFTALPQAEMKTPFDTAAMLVAALCVHPENKSEAIAMINYLRGPRPLMPIDESFITERLRGVDYLPASYFNGATPQNGYIPTEPYTIVVSDGPYSYTSENMASLLLKSGGADTVRQVQLRLAKDGKWYLWEHQLLPGIRKPESQNPWA
jgi:hypothetical protein